MRTCPAWGNRAQSAAVHWISGVPVTYPAILPALAGTLATLELIASIMTE
jgi:hypothetical protein